MGAKCTLLARVDAYGQDPSGSAGETMKDDMRKKVEKWQEPALAKQTKASLLHRAISSVDTIDLVALIA